MAAYHGQAARLGIIGRRAMRTAHRRRRAQHGRKDRLTHGHCSPTYEPRGYSRLPLTAAFERFESGDPESLTHALTSCRRLLSTVADG
jgi:hypothetical protein